MNNNAEICEFIHHLFGTQDFVPLSAPKFIGNEKKYLNECIDTTFVSSVGAFVDRFEHDMAVYTGATCRSLCEWYQCPSHGHAASGCRTR